MTPRLPFWDILQAQGQLIFASTEQEPKITVRPVYLGVRCRNTIYLARHSLSGLSHTDPPKLCV